eukprot:3763284-Rhodomonas_salina.1
MSPSSSHGHAEAGRGAYVSRDASDKGPSPLTLSQRILEEQHSVRKSHRSKRKCAARFREDGTRTAIRKRTK